MALLGAMLSPSEASLHRFFWSIRNIVSTSNKPPLGRSECTEAPERRVVKIIVSSA